MPIYAYKCGTCGHAKDVLQKISDAPLTTCPACGAEAFSKQVTAAGFQLKGSGWYVTDFRGGSGSGGGNQPFVTGRSGRRYHHAHPRLPPLTAALPKAAVRFRRHDRGASHKTLTIFADSNGSKQSLAVR